MQPQNTNPNPNSNPSPVRPVGAAGAAGAARPIRPVVRRPVVAGGAAATPVTEPAKVDGPTFDNGPSIVGSKGSRKTGWILAIILLLLIAAGGVGFGVWMWMDGNTQKEALNNQINSLQQTNNDLMAQLDNANSTVSVDADGNEVDTADYIYVGEWGLKIKIPEDLNKVSYEFAYGVSDEVGETTSITVSGVIGDTLSEFANFEYNNSGLGAVRKFSKATGNGSCIGSQMVFDNEEFIYCYFHPQALYSVDGSSDNLGAENEAVDLVEEMLKNSENYSAI